MDDGGWSEAIVGPLLWLSSLIFQTPFSSITSAPSRSAPDPASSRSVSPWLADFSKNKNKEEKKD